MHIINGLARKGRSVDEYWVCQHCRSLNRAGSGRCYSCKKKFGSKPKELEIGRPGTGSGNRPSDAGGSGAGSSGGGTRPVALSTPPSSGSGGIGSRISSSPGDGELPSYF